MHLIRDKPIPPLAPIEPISFFTGINFGILGVAVDNIATLRPSASVILTFVRRARCGSEDAAVYWATGEGLLATLLLGALAR
jgi:hypothetical protein